MSFIFLFLLSIAIGFLDQGNCHVPKLDIAFAPAVWGDPAPDYSAVVLGEATTRYIYTLLFVDDKITAHYDFDMLRVKKEILKVVEEANTYFNQLRIGIVVVDVLQTMRSNLSLHMFQEYRNARLHKLPAHDFATLMAFRYPGGLAYVGGMCTELSVMLCGFYPQEPSVMGSIFFHEVAHLVGVPHKAENATLYVSNCACTGQEEDTTAGCLKIPGFEHDCTAQQLANVLYKNKCLRMEPLKSRSEPICGNGVVEDGESCDCGLRRQCSAVNCVPETCSYRLHPAWIWLFVLSFFCVSILVLYLVLRNKGYRIPKPKVPKMLNCFKPPRGKPNGFKNPATSRNFPTGTLDKTATFPGNKVDPNSIVILLDRPPRAATIHRPKIPPPPPPPSRPKTTISVEPGANLYEVPNSQSSSLRDDLSWKFEDFDSDEDEPVPTGVMTYSSYRGQPGVPTCPSYPPFTPINRVTVQFHGSRDTMETECRSSSNGSSSSGLNGTSM